MKTSLQEKLVLTLLAGTLLVVAANAWLAFHAEQVLANTEFWVAHTWEVIDDLEHAMSLVKDVETGARGYLITGDPHYLDVRDDAVRLLPGELAHLRQLISDNPSQVRRMEELSEVARRRVALIAQIVETRRTQGQAAAFALVNQGTGIAEMVRLRTLSNETQELERTLLAKRLADSARARAQARVTVALASGLDIAFILITLTSLAYERRLRQKASETAQRLQKLQAISDVGLTRLSVSDLTEALLARLRSLAEIDAVILGAWQDGEIRITAADGVAIAPGTCFTAGPGSAITQSGQGNRAVRLFGADIHRLGIAPMDEQMRSILVLPLSVETRVIGLLVVGRSAENAFREQDEDLLLVVADRIALAIDRTAIYEAEKLARRLAETAASRAEAATNEVQLLNAQLEERVRQRTAELEATNTELEAFSYSVSHDLRAPLRSVDGFSVALEEDYGDLLTGEGKHYLGRIRAGVQRMGQLIDALLQLSRITRAELTVEPVALSELALEVVQDLVHQNPDRQIEFVIEPGLHAAGDPRLLQAVFENMLGNAVKFTGKTAQARIEFGYSPERASYYIRDNGAGFDQQYAKKLFIAFQRLHGEKDFKGSGIGLATVARVIRRHRGTMSAEGAVGQGATFWFTLGGVQ